MTKKSWPIWNMPETLFNNRLAQRLKGKQKRFIVESPDCGVFVSQAHTLSAHCGQEKRKIKGGKP